MFTRSVFQRAGPAAAGARHTCRASVGMPLRAKILAPHYGRPIAQTELFSAKPGDEPEDVLFGSLFGLRTIELNRPRKHNSLNGSMIRKIAPRLLEWEKSDMANVVVMKGVGEKAFCAGGDVKDLAILNKEGPEGQAQSTEYFALEYQLDHLIATYRKPYVAFMDGITMGGGVGLSVHAPLRIATERTVFAMPETTIGFFPDVGASFFLPRMAGAVGTYLALTSERLKGANVFYAGIATHYLHSTSLPNLESRLAELRFKDYWSMEKRLGIISEAIEEYSTGLPHDEPILLSGELRDAVDRCFSKNTVDEIIMALRSETGETQAWAEKTLDTLHQRSPTSVHVSLRQMRVSRKWSIAETFRREHQMAAKFMQHPDFTEGVSALLIERPPKKASWQPASLEDISSPDEIAEPFFEKSELVKPLQLLNDRDYKKYPYGNLGLPSEAEVRLAVEEEGGGKRDVVRYFLDKTHAKQGVKEVVEEIITRKTRADGQGKLNWVS